jgi:molybdate transport system ATP-binding protein
MQPLGILTEIELGLGKVVVFIAGGFFAWIKIKESDLQLILILSKADDIPPFVTHVVHVEDMTCQHKLPLSDYRKQHSLHPVPVLEAEKEQRLLSLPRRTDDIDAESIVDLRNVSIRYGERTILNNLNWKVMNGERWALSGENGAGKSTLLSLVCADNPQSYACDITLFGRKRGTGESIWEIKKHIGYVSPEMHRAYMKNLPAIDIVASGLHDSVGLYRRTLPEQKAVCEWWMDIFGIAHLRDRDFLTLSSGEQRLCLLARAFVKDPQLLILDEPLHGLDARNGQLVKEIIDTFCRRPGKTLIMVSHYEEELPSCITHRLHLKKHV